MFLRIPNWDKYNERKDLKRKNYVWFKFQNDLPFDDVILELTPAHRWLWVVILCDASKKSSCIVLVNYRTWSFLTGMTPDEISEAIDLMRNAGLVEVSEADDPGGFPEKATLEKKRIEENKSVVFTPDLEKIYESYPRKVNNRKQFGMKRLAKDIQTAKDYDDLLTAVLKYRVYVSDKEERFIKQFATWAGEWREWVHFTPRQRTFLAEGVGE